MKFIKCEKIAFIQHILDLDSREFFFTKEVIQNITNYLLKKRNENFVNHN
jgi:hypothetical protein